MGKIVTITGCSGTGKSTVGQTLLDVLAGNLRRVESYTTRDPRPTDGEGEYEYVSEKDFLELEKARHFLWVAGHTGKRYGTTKASLDFFKDEEQYGLMFLVPSVLPTLLSYVGGNRVLPFFFVRPPHRELERRLIERGDTAQQISDRMDAEIDWDMEARHSGIPYRFIDSARSELECTTKILKYIEDTTN